ncbi:restriction endonuclease subunit S [Campylobacter fetus subsp. venerealis]|uniref:restriction endonuclease subunit S n=1 Tax=Campylobacter fetus TaxID=196 RepID=UPI0018E7C518|nr:restriction endonuclease subunit S [Campylobacter fetus]QQF51391.1 restriction endonuclease subunit S [Campylobacter fetus subsp. venerealis]
MVIADASEDYADIGKSAEIINLNSKAISGLHTFALRDKNSKFANGYKGYMLYNEYTIKQIRKMATGISVLSISKSNLSNLHIPLPPLKEQEKIAEILSTWDKAISNLDELITQKQNLKTALMQNLLSAKIHFKEFSDEWQEVKLGDIGQIYNGLSGKTAQDFNNGEASYITYKNIFDNSRININIFEKISIKDDEKQNLVKFGDIFFTTSSETPNEVAMSSVLLDNIDNVYLNSFCFGYRLNNFETLNPYFAKFYFRSSIFRNKILKLAQGSTRFNISKTQILKLKIKLPNLPEQQKIAEVLSMCDDEINLLKDKLLNLKLQKQGLMQKLLTGKVRVKI